MHAFFFHCKNFIYQTAYHIKTFNASTYNALSKYIIERQKYSSKWYSKNFKDFLEWLYALLLLLHLWIKRRTFTRPHLLFWKTMKENNYNVDYFEWMWHIFLLEFLVLVQNNIRQWVIHPLTHGVRFFQGEKWQF